MTQATPSDQTAARERATHQGSGVGASTSRGVALSLRNLVKEYPKTTKPAVRDVNLDIAPGEFMTFLGPSGSGKTTTLNMIAGFVSVTSGEILLAGEDVARMPAHKRDIGMVFQHYALFPHMTVGAERRLPARTAQGAQERDRQSGHGRPGQRAPRGLRGPPAPPALRRSAAACRRWPAPSSTTRASSSWTSRSVRSTSTCASSSSLRSRRLHRELGLTFVYVTHDQEEALALSDRIAVFNEGGIEQVGTPDELYEDPRTVFVAEFLGDSNVLRGTVNPDGRSLKGSHFELVLGNGRTRVRPGRSGAVVVRPERIHILTDGQVAAPEHNVLEAKVTEVVYLGAARKVVLEFPWGAKGLVREAMRLASSADRGDQVRVAWAPEESVLVPDGPDMYEDETGEDAG